MKLDELEQTLIRAARADLSPGAADRERNRAAVWSQLGSVSQVGSVSQAGSVSQVGLARPLGSQGTGTPGKSGAQGSGVVAGTDAAGAAAPLNQPAPFLARWGGWMALSLGLLLGGGMGGGLGFGWGWERGQAALNGAVLSRDGAARSGVDGAVLSGADSLGSGALALADGDSRSGAGVASEPGRGADAVPHGSDDASPSGSDGASFDARGSNGDLDGVGAAPSAKAANSKRRAGNTQRSSLAEELAMLQRARRAIADENGRLALGIVQELDERLPNGLLMEEREATRILSLCQLQRGREARQRAAVFLARYASSVYAPRVRQSCIADFESLAPNP